MPKEQTYLFYDLETTHTDPCFGQVLQFAAIRTNEHLEEIERYEIQIKLNADTIPSPGALIVNRIGIEQFSQGVTEYEAILKIHALLNAPGTISVGYNSLDFDDEFLRFKFYQHLLPPYTHQYTNQCGRMDIYPITTAFFAFRVNHLRWPRIDGAISLRLEHLNAENKLVGGQAHNAMTDVRATLALAKLLKQDAKMWEYYTGFFDKKTDQERTARCYDTPHTIGNKTYPIGIMIHRRSKAGVLTPVIGLGHSIPYNKQSLWLPLLNEDLLECVEKNIAKKTQVIRKKDGEPPFCVPAEERRLEKHFTDKGREVLRKILSHFAQHPNLFESIIQYHQNFRYPDVKNCDAAAALYQVGFPTPKDEKLFQQFHAAKPEEKSAIAAQFSNPTHRILASRILGQYFSKYASQKDVEIYNQHLASVFTMDESAARINFRGQPALTLTRAREEITAILAKAEKTDKQQLCILQNYRGYLARLPNMLTSHIVGGNFFLKGVAGNGKKWGGAALNVMHHTRPM